ncbi:1-hydroxycarotenoid 3,4-desaturase CrtD [Tabrizicola sp.]|uniref:1-hydroxycarotenoid 3,4-desaturase CrtD n=1 Tax=Tabrizicola sp. TaxID=2005166 RepID=UPI002736B8A7|nr:1-hydroxycarotenoid 3,4-desaturase CrtD [Tabrizicola sp.]MDP3194919.1 FAD-dependent oxidoreductase [Tabrizicola sp.]
MPSSDSTGRPRAVVIGAGMGGLAAAIRLAAGGCQVTVVEAADAPGGKARARATDAGPSAMGPTVLTLKAEVDALFALAGTKTEAETSLTRLPRLARHWWPGSGPLDLFADRDATIEAIRTFAGDREADGFARFDSRTRALYLAFETPVMQAAKPDLPAILKTTLRQPGLWPALLPGMTLDRWLTQFFRDPRLRQLFGRYATYVGGRPTHTPAVLSLVWQAEAQGVWAVADGIQALAQALARAAETLGVRFHYATNAQRITRQSGRIAQVETDRGHHPADIVVFNGDPRALTDGHLGEAAQTALKPPGKPSLSAWVWSFAATPQGPRAADLIHHNLFFTADPGAEFGPIGEGQMPESPTLYLNAQNRELGTIPALERFQIIMNGPANTSANRPDHPDEDRSCHDRTFPPLEQMGLTFSPPPGSEALTRPRDLASRFPASLGGIYGASPEGALAAFQRPVARTTLPGLYLAGGGVHPGAGVPMALISGKQAALQALSDLTSASTSGRTAMPGGMSTGSLRTERKPSR